MLLNIGFDGTIVTMSAEQLIPAGFVPVAPEPFDDELRAVAREIVETGTWSGAKDSEYILVKKEGATVYMGPNGGYIGDYLLVRKNEEEPTLLSRALGKLGIQRSNAIIIDPYAPLPRTKEP